MKKYDLQRQDWRVERRYENIYKHSTVKIQTDNPTEAYTIISQWRVNDS